MMRSAGRAELFTRRGHRRALREPEHAVKRPEVSDRLAHHGEALGPALGLLHPLVLADPQACEGHARQVERVLRRVDMEPLVAERVTSCDLMMALVSAGFGLGLTGAAHIEASREQGVVARPLAGRSPVLTTFLLRPEGEPSETLARFIERVQAIESPEARPTPRYFPDPPEGPRS